MIPLFKVFMSEKSIENVNQVLRSGYIGQGPMVEKFEEKLAEYFGTPYVLTVNSGTSALTLALHLIMNDKKYEDVFTSPLTCFATNTPIINGSHTPIWLDIDRSLNIDLDKYIESTDFIYNDLMVVHWGGNPVDMGKLVNIRNLLNTFREDETFFIEDCAHAFGTTFDGKHLPSFGNICCYSFQAIKHLTCGDGGLIVLPNEELYKRAKLLRWYGIDRENKNSGDFRCELPVKEAGYKFHMNDISASIGLGNFEYIEEILGKHRENAEFYIENLKSIVEIPTIHPKAEPSWWIFTILVERRQDFIRKMAEHGIQTSQVHQRNDLHPCCSNFRVNLPVLDELSEKNVSIPVGWWVTPENREYIVEKIKEGW